MSELRQDLVSGDWIILSTERAKRPHQLIGKNRSAGWRRKPTPVSKCPFKDLEKSGNWPPIKLVPGKGEWRLAIIPNKYPALRHGKFCALRLNAGPYSRLNGTGYHELAIVRNHFKGIAHMGKKDAAELFLTLQERCRELKKDKCLVYMSTFFNWGETAGASLYHPHIQMLTLPIVPPHISSSLSGSHDYFKKHKRCAHCEIIKFEMADKKRVIAENQHAIAVAPFASRDPFQVKIFPKKHAPYFENTPAAAMAGITEILQKALLKIEKNLRDPDLNFFVHTSPLKNQRNYKHYHWHIEILPKISKDAGFELSTGVEINIVDPDAAAEILRK